LEGITLRENRNTTLNTKLYGEIKKAAVDLGMNVNELLEEGMLLILKHYQSELDAEYFTSDLVFLVLAGDSFDSEAKEIFRKWWETGEIKKREETSDAVFGKAKKYIREAKFIGLRRE
jgi:hypothetical protein